MLEWLFALPTITRRVVTLETELTKVKGNVMDLELKFREALTAIDAETTRIAGELEALKEQLAGQGLPEAKEQEILATLQATAERLKGVGKTPEPEPETPVTPEA